MLRKLASRSFLFGLLVSAAVLAGFPRTSEAQGNRTAHPDVNRPVAVLAFAGLDQLLADARSLGEAMGMPEVSAAVALAGPALQGIDTTRPSGLLFYVQDLEPRGIAFVPIRNFDQVLRQLQEKLGQRPEDVRNGIQMLRLGEEVYFKQQGDWVFIADTREHLLQVPADPSGLVGDLTKTYDVAFRMSAENLPAAMRQTLLEQLEELAQSAEEEAEGEAEAQLLRENLRSVVRLIEGADALTVGIRIDQGRQNSFAEVSLTALPGSELAEQLQMLAAYQSQFTGFLLPEAAITLQFTGQIRPRERQQAQTGLQAVRDQLWGAIDQNPEVATPEAKDALKRIVGQTLDVVQETLADGTVDAGAAVVLEPDSLRCALGIRVANGKTVEKAFREFVEFVKGQPNVPAVSFNVATHEGVDFHQFAVPLPESDEDARRVFGPELPVTLGAGVDSLYLCVGPDGVTLLKRIIDRSREQQDQKVPPAQVSVALLPLVKYLADTQPEKAEALRKMVATLEQSSGQDHVLLTVRSLDGGVGYRLEIEPGVLRLLGQAIRLGRNGDL